MNESTNPAPDGPGHEGRQPGDGQPPATPGAGGEQVVSPVQRTPIPQIVSELKSTELQIGEHVVQALQDPNTVAVVTTVVMGPDGVQRVVSAGLDPTLMGEVQALLQRAQVQRVEEVPCVGFHCYVRPRDEADGD